LPTIEIFLTGDQIGTYASVDTSGNNNGMKVTLNGVQPLGDADDVLRVVVTQGNNGQTEFSNGQFVAIYAYPDSVPPAPPIYSGLNPQHDQFQGRASSDEHQIFTQPANIVFDVEGVTAGTMRYGPGLNPPRAEKLDFDAFAASPPAVNCFVAGTLIATDAGQVPVQDLQPGDRVRTLDHGFQPLVMLAQTEVDGTGAFAPVGFAPGALGNDRWLFVSPQHRMLLTDWRAALWFGDQQVLVAARHLINDTTIRLAPRPRVTYVHLVFAQHEIVFAQGIPSESLHLGAMALSALDRAARAEVMALFPELAGCPADHVTARTCLSGWEGRLMQRQTIRAA